MRRHKYNAKKTEIDGITFDSKAEAMRYRQLQLLERAGHIQGLELQPEFILLKAFKDAAGKRHAAIKYRADFGYIEGGQRVVEDVKGIETPVFRLKAKMFRYHYPQYDLRVVQ